MKVLKFGLLASLVSIWPNSANAMQSDAPVWQKITTDQGCVAYLYDRNDAQFPGWRVYHWTGTCTSGLGIQGSGALQEHGLFFEERFVNERRGTMVGGYFQGAMSWQPYQVNEQGNWNSAAPLADLAYTKQYDRGCAVDQYKQFCEQDRVKQITAKISKKPLWKDVKETALTAAVTQTAPPASPPKPGDLIWSKLQSNGCTLIFNHGFDALTADYAGDFKGNKILSVGPSFACGADGLAQGPVRIALTWQLANGKESGAVYVDALTTNAKDGFIEGKAQQTTVGAVSWAGKTSEYNFIGGCRDIEANCNRAAGQQLRAGYLAGREKAAVGTNTVAPQEPPPPAFSKTETVAFDNLGTSLAELVKNVGPGGFQNEQAKIEAIVAQLGLSFYSGQGAAFGGDYARVQAVQNAVRTLLAGKGASADAGQLATLVLGAVKDSLATSKSVTVVAPVAPVIMAAPAPAPAPAPAVVAPTPRPVAAPIQAVPQQVATAPVFSFATLSSLPFEQRWSLRDAGRGCKVILRDGDVMQDASGFTVNGQLNRFEWTGACGANGLAQGSGSLMVLATGEFRDGRMLMTGMMTDGLFNGAVQAQDQEYVGGKWSTWSEYGEPRNYTMQFTNGCAADNFLGPCNTAYGSAMRANYLAGSARVSAIPVAPPRQPVPAAQPIATSPSAVMIGPKLLTNVGSMMLYPPEALRNGWQGLVGFSVSVSMIGAPMDCRITTSSGYPVLDNATCDMMRRTIFSPAKNGAGTPVNGTYSSRIRWVLPE